MHIYPCTSTSYLMDRLPCPLNPSQIQNNKEDGTKKSHVAKQPISQRMMKHVYTTDIGASPWSPQ